VLASSDVNPEDYNRRALDDGLLTPEHVTALVRSFQLARGLTSDGKAGPVTRAVIERDRLRHADLSVDGHLLEGPGVERVLAHTSWYGGAMPRGPLAIVAHYTDTEPGTARSLAERRTKRRLPLQRAASWHVTIAQDGTVYQLVPLDRVAWHCGAGRVEDLRTNEAAIGIELEGRGDSFSPALFAAACRVWTALARAYGIPRERAMLEHSALDSKRRRDPGPVFMRTVAPGVLACAYGDSP
jgi:hypothetical protein